MTENSLIFHICEPRVWRGRYDRVMGDGGLFHVRDNQVVIEWKKENEIGHCIAQDSPAIRELVRLVVQAKRLMGGDTGGGFLINEWGQVIVPASAGDGRRIIVGSITGRILFLNPFIDNLIIDLSKDSNLTTGDLWIRPYIGIQYHMSAANKIYFNRSENDCCIREYLDTHDLTLQRKLRNIRPSGGIRFIVNPHGLVLTKKPLTPTSRHWRPIYVGRINFTNWFNKEN